jgi:cell division protease FtsH
MHRIAEELLREETIPGERVRAILKETAPVQKSQEG